MLSDKYVKKWLAKMTWLSADITEGWFTNYCILSCQPFFNKPFWHSYANIWDSYTITNLNNARALDEGSWFNYCWYWPRWLCRSQQVDWNQKLECMLLECIWRIIFVKISLEAGDEQPVATEIPGLLGVLPSNTIASPYDF